MAESPIYRASEESEGEHAPEPPDDAGEPGPPALAENLTWISNTPIMSDLAVLSEPRTFPPKKFLLVVWLATLAVAFYGLFVTAMLRAWTIVAWSAITFVSFWQLWGIRWIQVDSEGIRMRNMFRRGRELRWDEVTEYREEEVRLSGKPYVIVHLSNRGTEGIVRVVRIQITNDQVGFDLLREIVRNAVPETVR